MPVGPARWCSRSLPQPHERQDVAAEADHLVELRSASDDELCDADVTVRQERVGELAGRADERDGGRTVVRHEAGPEVLAEPAAIVGRGERIVQGARVAAL